MKFGVRISILLVVLQLLGGIFAANQLHAQTAVHVFAVQQALQNDDFASAGNLIQEIWNNDNASLYQLGDAAFEYFTHQQDQSQSPKLNKAQADSLLYIYSTGIQHDPLGPKRWLTDRFFLISVAPHFEKKTQKWAFEAIKEDPFGMHNYVYKKWAEVASKAYLGEKISLKQFATEWLVVDEGLLMKELGPNDEARDAVRTRNSVRHLMRGSLPSCEILSANFKDAILSNTLDPKGLETFLLVYSLQDCIDETLWDKAFETVSANGCQAWLLRTAGEISLRKIDRQNAIAMFRKSAECEASAQLKALDMLQVGWLQIELNNFREGTASFRKAITIYPNWGEPYLRLIDAYQLGSRSCGMSEFDRKALNWLLIDLCEQMANADPSYSKQATDLSYRFWQAAPNAKEAAFKGLSEGDSWPLKCWMNTTVRAKLH